METVTIVEKITKTIEPTIEALNLELVDVEYVLDGGHLFIRVFIEGENGTNLDDCEKVSRSIDEDVDVLVSDKFFLEVSSPGLERPLKKIKTFKRFVGDKVNIKLKRKIDEIGRLKGMLVSANDECIVVENDGKEYEVTYKEIDKAKLLFEFDN